jgi:hypothetical protein
MVVSAAAVVEECQIVSWARVLSEAILLGVASSITLRVEVFWLSVTSFQMEMRTLPFNVSDSLWPNVESYATRIILTGLLAIS